MSLRSFVETFPPLKIALYVNDAVCYVFSRLIDLLYYVVKSSFKLVYFIVKHLYGPIYRWLSLACSKLANALPPVRRFREEQERRKYERLKDQSERAKLHHEPVPYYEGQLVKRTITYQGGLLLALFMYVFVYFVLIKHHTYLSISVAFVFMLVYLIIVENSHNFRSIIMLCLPIMFTNRGRALVFCSMLAMLAGGPIRTMQHNVREIHTSLNCCKQYLVVQTDKYVGDNVVKKLVRVEEVVMDLVNNIKMFANNLKNKLDGIIQMAIETELFIEGTIRKLKDALNFCNHHTSDIHKNCAKTVNTLFVACNSLLNPFGFCTVIARLKGICKVSAVPDMLCELPRHVVDFFQQTIGRKLAEYVDLIENEFYVNVDVNRSYGYNLTKSKSYTNMTREIKFDVEQKFWYVHLVRRVFNFISLILVTWIFLTATIYHMHYLRELAYDNMYLDERLDEAAHQERVTLTAEHEKHYLRPFSVHMNKIEVSKLYTSGLVWLIIVGYIAFFVTLDFALAQLVEFLVETLRDILFTSDLPLVDLETKSQRTNGSGLLVEDKIVRYNRTYLRSLRKQFKSRLPHAPTSAATTTMNATAMTTDSAINGRLTNNRSSADGFHYTTNGTVPSNQTSEAATSSIQALYDRLTESIERDIPDDVAILESLEGCLPRVHMPIYDTYRALLYLAVFTFGAVIVEAYAMRTRHCIANLYYPRRARLRAKWLFRKIMSEKSKYEAMDEDVLAKVASKKKRGKVDYGEKSKPREELEHAEPDKAQLSKRSERSVVDLDDDDEPPSLGYGFESVE